MFTAHAAVLYLLMLTTFGCATSEVKEVDERFWPTIVKLEVTSTRPNFGNALVAEAIQARLKSELEGSFFTAVLVDGDDPMGVPEQWKLKVSLDGLAVHDEWEPRPKGSVLGFPVVASLVWYGTFFGAFAFNDREYPVSGGVDVRLSKVNPTDEDALGLELTGLIGGTEAKALVGRSKSEADQSSDTYIRKVAVVADDPVEIDFFDRYRFDQLLLSFVWPAVLNGDEELAAEKAFGRAEDAVVERIIRAVATQDFSLERGRVELLIPAPGSMISTDRPTARFRIYGKQRLTNIQVRAGDHVVESWNEHRLDAIAKSNFDGSFVYYIDVPVGPLTKGPNVVQVVLDDRDVANFILNRVGDSVRNDLL